ncbi:TolC family protein [Gemmatimonas groenlandica]|uniref:TolC family protein n=1 Tax=Gemmatimonas groenlandica TaxID=2732249 RepID=A0A6M4IT63_9BACT|nr:TolC family protein [Gemmatimonas groenlandica]QJR37923.1 TolC family protein [Gemmatimonas groenlandica]
MSNAVLPPRRPFSQRFRRLASAVVAVIVCTPHVGLAQVTSPRAEQISASDTITSVVTVLRHARDVSPAARISQSSSRIASRTADLAAVPLSPFVSLDATALRQTLNLATFGFPGASAASDPFSVYNVGVRAQQTLLDASAWRRMRAQRDSARAALGDDVETRDAIGTGAAVRYFQLLAADANRTGREADSTLAAAVLADVAARRQVGETTDIDVTRARLGVTVAAARLVDARATTEQARLDLALSMGLAPVMLPMIRDTLRAPIASDSTVMAMEGAIALEVVIARRGDVQASRARAQSASNLISARRLELLPRVTAFGDFSATGVQTSTLPAVYRAGIQASVPLVDGFSRRRRAGIDAERERIAANAAEMTRLRAAREVHGAIVDVKRAMASLASADAQLALSLEELQQARTRVRAGVGNSLETTQAIAAVATAREQVVAGRLRYHLARVEWHRASATLDALR